MHTKLPVLERSVFGSGNGRGCVIVSRERRVALKPFLNIERCGQMHRVSQAGSGRVDLARPGGGGIMVVSWGYTFRRFEDIRDLVAFFFASLFLRLCDASHNARGTMG